MSSVVHVGDCRAIMADLAEASIDAIVCDPPYELGFMGKSWDASGIAYDVEMWRLALRALKPGGYLLAFSATRTYHRMTCAIEDAGFEIRDCFSWMYGSGFPKSLDVSKAIDKAAGAERELVGRTRTPFKVDAAAARGTSLHGSVSGDFSKQMDDSGYRYTEHTAPATDDARRWAGWGTALKPAWEPIVVARKPLEGTVAGNVLKHGTGALNIDGCRVDGAKPATTRGAGGRHGRYGPIGAQGRVFDDGMGRWPANVLLSCQPDCDGDTHAEGCPCDSLDRQSGGGCASRFFNRLPIESDDLSPFIYTAKASRSEREEGCEELTARTPPAVEAQGHQQASGLRSPRAGAGRLAETVQNNHPTVKPESVMRHLVRLVTRPGGTVLDPFTGSGTTGVAAVLEGMNFVGCEMSEEYAEIARARLRAAVPPLFRVAL